MIEYVALPLPDDHWSDFTKESSDLIAYREIHERAHRLLNRLEREGGDDAQLMADVGEYLRPVVLHAVNPNRDPKHDPSVSKGADLAWLYSIENEG